MRALIVISMLVSILATSVFATFGIRAKAGPVYASSSIKWFRSTSETLLGMEHWFAASLNRSQLIRWAYGELGALPMENRRLTSGNIETTGALPDQGLLAACRHRQSCTKSPTR
jgi:hypothetical protein